MGDMKFNRAVQVGVRPDGNGYLRGTARVLTPGVFAYDGGVMEWIPEEEVFSDAAMASMVNLPLVLPTGHDRKLSPDDVAQVSCGSISNPRREGDWVMVDVCIASRDGIDCVASGEFAELSLSYESRDVRVPGVTPEGLKYDVKQTRLDCNHVALVDRARMGSGARVLKLNRSSRPMNKININGKEWEVAPEVASHLAELEAKASAAGEISLKLNRATSQTVEKDGQIAMLNARVAELSEQVDNIRTQGEAEVAQRVALAAELGSVASQKFNSDTLSGMSGVDLRIALITHHVGEEAAREFKDRTASDLDLVLAGIRKVPGNMKHNRASEGIARPARKGDANFGGIDQQVAAPSYHEIVMSKRGKSNDVTYTE